MIKHEGIPSQRWYGMTAFAFLSSTIVSSYTYVILKFLKPKEKYLTPYATKLVGIISTSLIVSCLGYLAFHEFLKWGIL